MPSPTNTGAVGTRPEQPPGTAHPHTDATPQPQTPPDTSTHGHQPAASRAVVTQAHPEPHRRRGTPDRPTAGPANAPPENPPPPHATLPDTTTTRHSDTEHPQAHNPTEGPNTQALGTSSTAAGGHAGRGTTPQQPGRRYGPQNRHLPVARPPTPPPVSEGHVRGAVGPADDAATPPARPTQPQREEPTVDTEDMEGPPQRTTIPPTVG